MASSRIGNEGAHCRLQPVGLASGFPMARAASAVIIDAMRTLPLAFAAIVAVAVTLAVEPFADADQTDARLPGLFEQLKTAPTATEAKAVEMQIWSIWTVSSNDEVNQLMAEGISAMNQADPKT